MRRLAAPLTLSLTLALVLACSATSSGSPAAAGSGAAASSGSGSAAQTVTVQGTDALRFVPATITVKAGQPITLTFTNSGQMLHDWTLAQGAGQPVTIAAAAGRSASGNFTITQPGTYTFICSQPGHEAGGMKGTITAQ